MQALVLSHRDSEAALTAQAQGLAVIIENHPRELHEAVAAAKQKV